MYQEKDSHHRLSHGRTRRHPSDPAADGERRDAAMFRQASHDRGHADGGRRTADALRGTSGPDVIVGLGGNDVIRGRGRDDRICGAKGNDAIIGAGDGLLQPDEVTGLSVSVTRKEDLAGHHVKG